MENKIAIGFIGSGKVACSLGKYFQLHQILISGYYSKKKSSSEFAASRTNTVSYDQISQLVEDSNIIFITVPDDQIGPVWKQLLDQVPPMIRKGKCVFHCSGIHSSKLFEESEHQQIQVGSLHPICAISDREIGYQSLEKAIFSYEGNEKGKDVIRELLRRTGNTGVEVEASQKVRYHAAAVFSSNLVIGLLKEGMDILVDCGFTQLQAEAAVVSLAIGNMKNIETQGIENALTGPIERNDFQTVQLHLAALNEQEGLIYRSLSKKIIFIAEKNHPDRDYTKIKEIL